MQRPPLDVTISFDMVVRLKEILVQMVSVLNVRVVELTTLTMSQ